jgi:Ca2+-binding EF-hand superfamily protein
MLQESRQVTGKQDCKVTKTQLLRFFETKFDLADRDHDGQLNISELSQFLRYVTHPDLRSLHAWDRYDQTSKGSVSASTK